MKQSLTLISMATGLVSEAHAFFSKSAEEVKPGVFRIPLKKRFVDLGEHPSLQSMHPRVGNWSDAEMWDQQVKSPLNSLSQYMYTMDCTLGSLESVTDEPQSFQCLIDTTTSISSTLGSIMQHTYSEVTFQDDDSPTYKTNNVTKTFNSIGLTWTGL